MRYPLSTTEVRAKLIRELALGAKQQKQLAEEYGVVKSAISQFRTRNIGAIMQVQADMDEEL